MLEDANRQERTETPEGDASRNLTSCGSRPNRYWTSWPRKVEVVSEGGEGLCPDRSQIFAACIVITGSIVARINIYKVSRATRAPARSLPVFYGATVIRLAICGSLWGKRPDCNSSSNKVGSGWSIQVLLSHQTALQPSAASNEGSRADRAPPPISEGDQREIAQTGATRPPQMHREERNRNTDLATGSCVGSEAAEKSCNGEAQPAGKARATKIANQLSHQRASRITAHNLTKFSPRKARVRKAPMHTPQRCQQCRVRGQCFANAARYGSIVAPACPITPAESRAVDEHHPGQGSPNIREGFRRSVRQRLVVAE